MQAKLTRIFSLLALAFPANAMAGGFAISETGSRYAGRANAATALSDSASSIFINPANISALKGFNFTAGVSLVFPSFEYAPLSGAPAEGTAFSVSTPPVLALTYTLPDLGGVGDLAFGLGFSVPYGSKFEYPDTWIGREAVQAITLTGYEFLPAAAFRYKELFAVGAGFRILAMGLSLKRAVTFGDQSEGAVELAGDGISFGATAGATVWPIEGLAISVAWRSASTLDATGNANFSFPAPFDLQGQDAGLEGTLPLPQIIRAGVAYDLIKDKLNVSADFQYQFWDTYQSLDVTFVNDDGSRRTTSDPRLSANSIVLYVGGELKVTEDFAVRAGYAFDQHTQPEEVIGPAPPDSDRHVIALGASYMLGAIGVHFHLADVIFAEREALTNALPGTWRGGSFGGTTALIGSIEISGKFGGEEPKAEVQ